MRQVSLHRKFRIFSSMLLGGLLLCPAISNSYDKDTYADQRKDYIAAEKALNRGQLGHYRELATRLSEYPLYPYLKFKRMHRELGKLPDAEVHKFLVDYNDSPVSSKLRHAWLRKLASRQQWQTLVDNYYLVKNTQLHCHYSRALFEIGDTRATEVAKELWLTGKSMPASCQYSFKRLREVGILNDDLTWKRIQLAIYSGRSQLARHLGKTLPAKDKNLLQLWLKVRRKHELLSKVYNLNTDYRPEVVRWMIVDGVRSMARKKELQATRVWLDIRDDYQFTPEDHQRIERRLIYKLSQNENEQAQHLFKELTPAIPDNRMFTYYTLSALQDRDWKSALNWMGRLDATEQQDSRWRYWRARALEALGHLEEARGLYLLIANDRSYYSFLASDRSGLSYRFEDKPIEYSDEELLSLKKFPALLRAGELFFLKRIVEARREWNVAIRQMNREQLLKASKLAQQFGWYDRAIITMAQAGYWDDLELRFPLAHQNLVLKHANRQKINPAWAFAIIRQESAFTADARSHAGAMGLMQLMPRTARQVARSMRIRRPKRHDLINVTTNVRLGVRYLKKVYDKFKGNSVLATAAYNAGGHRVKQWLPESGSTPADIWVEQVPFQETQDYLKRVLVYTIIYEKRLGLESVPLLKRMLPIQGKDPIVLSSKVKKQAPDV
ncbi:MAG: transglycosylase SLT domain-containing protein [Gammaproteobacteria bacterium]|nr:transglycosylase SLT domain-containing protein [Gammaproteobacteria bacterium]